MNGPLPLPRPIVTRAATCDVFFPASRRCARRPQKGPSTASMADRPAGRPTDCLIPLRPTTLTRTYAPPRPLFFVLHTRTAPIVCVGLSLSLSPLLSPPPPRRRRRPPAHARRCHARRMTTGVCMRLRNEADGCGRVAEHRHTTASSSK